MSGPDEGAVYAVPEDDGAAHAQAELEREQYEIEHASEMVAALVAEHRARCDAAGLDGWEGWDAAAREVSDGAR